jgi:alpha-L-fucosidase 2
MKRLFQSIILFTFLLLFACNVSQKPSPDTTLYFKHPAKHFTESSPIGNGKIGAMVFGDPNHERIVLNEHTLWPGGEQDADKEDAYKYLPKIQKLLLKGNNKDAQDLLQKHFVCKGVGSGSPKEGAEYHYGCYQTLGDLRINWNDSNSTVTGYSRVLDIENAISTVSWSKNNGINYSEEAFTSLKENILVLNLKATKGKLNFSTSMSRKERAKIVTRNGYLMMSGQLQDEDKLGMKYAAIMQAVNQGGRQTIVDNEIHVEGASECILYLTAATNYNVMQGGLDNSLPEGVVVNTLNNAIKEDYNTLKVAHIAAYQEYFNACRFNLTSQNPAVDSMSTEERLIYYSNNGNDPQLPVLYFNYGRYLLISSSCPDGVPANLQGLWAEEYLTPWNGDYHLNINLQMNYWPADVTGLSSLSTPLFRLIEQMVPNGEKTAKAYYNAPGWVAHVITNPWHFTSPGEGARWGSTLSGGAWLCRHIWEHYNYTHDKDFLRKYYPILKGAAQFLESILIEEPEHHYLVTAPSNSPENSYIMPNGFKGSTCMGPTMDMQICRDLFAAVISSAQILNIDSVFADKLSETRKRLAPTVIGKDGDINEWLDDWEDALKGSNSHASQLYGLYPYDEITPWDTPELAKAAIKTLDTRGENVSGWGAAWRINFWARLGNGDKALNFIHRLLKPLGAKDSRGSGGTYPNLFDACAPFQIDGNFGGTAGMAEMLLQSHGKDENIRLLPALPSNPEWQSGSIKGLHARGAFVVNFSWEKGEVTKGELISNNGNECKMFFRRNLIVSNSKGEIVATGKGTVRFTTVKGEKYVFKTVKND